MPYNPVNQGQLQRMGPRLLDFSRINLSPSRSQIMDSLKYWAGEVRALGLDTLEGCKRVINTPDR